MDAAIKAALGEEPWIVSFGDAKGESPKSEFTRWVNAMLRWDSEGRHGLAPRCGQGANEKKAREQVAKRHRKPTKAMEQGGIIQIEMKEDIKKRIGRSPDDGDAVVMALATRDSRVQLRRNDARAIRPTQPLSRPGSYASRYQTRRHG